MCMLEIRLIMDEKTNSNEKEKKKEFIYFTVTSIVTLTRPFPSFRRGVPMDSSTTVNQDKL